MAETIVRLEAEIRPPVQDDACARDPIGLFPVDQVPHHIERTERVETFGAADPGLAEAAEERLEDGGGTSKDIDRQVKIEERMPSP